MCHSVFTWLVVLYVQHLWSLVFRIEVVLPTIEQESKLAVEQ